MTKILSGFKVGDYVEWMDYIMKVNPLNSPSVHDDIVDAEIHRGNIVELYSGGQYGIPSALIQEDEKRTFVNLYQLRKV